MRIQVIDSHTGGEPTRVVLEGGPPLQGATLAEMREDFAARFDDYRSAIVNEPRGSDVLVGALLTPPENPGSVAGVIFFNNVGMLGMCGHGTIGLVETLRYLGHIKPGTCNIDTPVGTVTVTLAENGEVSVQNVASYRYLADVEVDVPGVGMVVGDVGYGGNWFFIVHQPTWDLRVEQHVRFTDIAWDIRLALTNNHITGAHGAEIDHIELFGPPHGDAQSRNFVLCPGRAYDRSPCGTGTSAKLACLVAAGKLEPGVWYRQESVTGSVFRGKVDVVDGQILPTIVGSAHVTAETVLILEANDPLQWGIRP